MIPNCLFRMRVAIAPRRGHHLRQSALIAIIAGTVALGLVNALKIRAQAPPTTTAPLPTFDVVSIKPNHLGGYAMHQVTASGFKMINLNTRFLIEFAYGRSAIPPYDALRPSQLVGGPSWIKTDQYDVEAKVDDSLAEKFAKAPHEKPYFRNPNQDVTYQIQLMMQSMLVERFHLKVHREMREGPIFALVVAKGGPKFLNTKFPELDAVLRDSGQPPTHPAHMPPCTRGLACMIRRMSMSELAYTLWDFGDHGVVPEIGRPVVDQTGLTGDYDIQLQWAPELRPGMLMGPINANPAAGAAPPPEPAGPSFMTALQEQLGLKLEPAKGSVEYVVVDHIDRPSEN
jgi:uncharacterized protein (TIGR03435 family)